MNAHPILLQKMDCRIIERFTMQRRLSLDAALRFFYHSIPYQLMRESVSDMHCMSDGYLTEDPNREYAKKTLEQFHPSSKQCDP